MHLTKRYYDYYTSDAYRQYIQRRNIIMGVCISISILTFLYSLNRYLKKRRENKAAQEGAPTNAVQNNGGNANGATEPKLDYTYPPHQNGQNSVYPSYTPDNNQQNQAYSSYNPGQNQPYPNYTPESNQQNHSYPPNYALPHYNPNLSQNNQAPQGAFPGGFMPQANGQQFGYPPQSLYPPQAQVYPPENAHPSTGVNSQPLQYPPGSQPALNQRSAETAPSSPVEPVKDSTK